MAQGTPEQVARVKKSYTGQALSSYFNASERNVPERNGSEKNGSAKARAANGALAPEVEGNSRELVS